MASPFEEGPRDAKIALVGEAPSTQEIKKGRPFCGPAGRVLDKALELSGIERSQCYVTNLFECQIRKSSSGAFLDPQGRVLYEKNKLTEPGEEHRQRLLERLRVGGANVICPMGGPALQALFGDHRIMRWRGSILESPSLKRKLVPTIHPSAILQGMRQHTVSLYSDMARVLEESESPEIQLPKRNLIIEPDMEYVEGWLENFEEEPQQSFDIETSQSKIACIAFSSNPSEALCIPFLYKGGRYWTPAKESWIWERIAWILSLNEGRKVGQNLTFDMAYLQRHHGIETRGPVGDTMVAQSVMWPDLPKGLDYIASIHTREPYWKDEGKQWREIKDYETFWRYNAKDAAVTLEAWHVLSALLDERGYRETYEMTVEMYPALVGMMTRGMRVDAARLEEAKRRAREDEARTLAELREVAQDETFKPKSSAQCAKLLYDTLGLRKRTKRGKVTTDEKALLALIAGGSREADLILRARKLRDLQSKQLNVKYDPDERIRCSYNPRGTWTGRLSSSKNVDGGGFNMQNLPESFRSFLVADRSG